MTTFRGRAHIKLDLKGRLSFPSAFRAALNSAKSDAKSLVVTGSLYKRLPCLDLFLPADWTKLENKIARHPALKPEVQVFQRFYLSSGEACDLDAQLRLLLPQHLREYAKLEGDIVLVGMGNKIEIWSEKIWHTIFSQLMNDFEDAAKNLAEDEAGDKTGKKK